MFQEIVESWINNWNRKDIDKCALMLSDDVELRSTHLMKVIPDTGGVLKGRQTAVKYFSIIFEKYPEITLKHALIKAKERSVIVSATNGEKINTYAQYFFNEEGQFSLILADVTDEEYNVAISA